MAEIVLLGEPMVVFAANTVGKLEEVETFTRFLAGAEANVAIGLSRLEHDTCYVTKLGNDPFGRFIEKKLHSEGVLTQIAYDQNHLTGFYLKSKVVAADPEVSYFRKNSAASWYGPEDVEWIDLSETKLVHVTGIMPALSENCLQATIRLMKRAREKGITVSFDPNLRPALWKDKETMISRINELAELADIVLPGVGEGRILAGTDEPEKIAEFYQSKGAKIVAVKAGPKGAYVLRDGSGSFYPGFRVENVVDTVGAGDAFATGFLSAYLEGLTTAEMAERANALGAMQVCVAGDNDGLPTRKKLADFLDQNRK